MEIPFRIACLVASGYNNNAYITYRLIQIAVGIHTLLGSVEFNGMTTLIRFVITI